MHEPSETGSITLFFDQCRQGNAAAAEQIWTRFYPRLAGLARRHLGSTLVRSGDANDAVQSAFASFFQRVRQGEFAIDNRDDLWNLLGLITQRKAQAMVRREMAQKRGGGRVLDEAALRGPDDAPMPLAHAATDLTAPEFDLHVTELLEQLDSEVREIALCRLMGFKNREIAARLKCTERKVERKLQLIRLAWEATWPD